METAIKLSATSRYCKVEMVEMDCQAPRVLQAGMAKMEMWDLPELQEPLASRGHLDLLALRVEEWSTLAGDEPPALTHLGQNWSMLE